MIHAPIMKQEFSISLGLSHFLAMRKKICMIYNIDDKKMSIIFSKKKKNINNNNNNDNKRNETIFEKN